MRILFIGQAPFGAESLQALLDQNEQIVGAITIPDPPNPRFPNPVKECAEKHEIPVLLTRYLKKPEAVSWVRELKPDLLVLAFVTSFVPQEMIDLAPLGGINYHPSLLPKYRGGSAINWAVIAGETETGVTIHYIDEGVDTGPVLLQEKVAITPDDTVKSVYFEKLYPLGVSMIAKAVTLIKQGKAEPRDQDDAMASFQPVITPDDTAIDWKQPTQQIYNLIRGANPAPGAHTELKGERYKIFNAKPATPTGNPGSILLIDEAGITVATGDGSILVEVMQPPKQKKLDAKALADQLSLQTGDAFGA
ncbi:MAG: methionyl-tRNA formyltransferase [Desulfobulbaceae bacterium]|nr:MAG: methionyl-tRNA formyltransferase [Desulfobulbaceae bacterium]